MSREYYRKSGPAMARIYLQHARWLEANGYKQQASSCKRQASSLTRRLYGVIGESRRKDYAKKEKTCI